MASRGPAEHMSGWCNRQPRQLEELVPRKGRAGSSPALDTEPSVRVGHIPRAQKSPDASGVCGNRQPERFWPSQSWFEPRYPSSGRPRMSTTSKDV